MMSKRRRVGPDGTPLLSRPGVGKESRPNPAGVSATRGPRARGFIGGFTLTGPPTEGGKESAKWTGIHVQGSDGIDIQDIRFKNLDNAVVVSQSKGVRIRGIKVE